MQQSMGNRGINTQQITIYTDGSCLRNPGPGGCAYILIQNNIEISEAFFYPNTTNNRMELSAVIMALKALDIKKVDLYTKILIYSDSTYVVNGINKWIYGWIKKNWHDIKNPDLWKEILLLKTKYMNMKFSWIKAHNGDYYNEKVDQLARNIIK